MTHPLTSALRAKCLLLAGLCAVGLTLAIPAGAGAAMVTDPGCSANVLPANDDGSTGQIALPFELNFFGEERSSLWVNNNGNVTFTGPLSTYTPFNLTTTGEEIIAAFFSDIDTRPAASDKVTYGEIDFGSRTAFCVNWGGTNGVGYYNQGTDRLNKIQLLLVDRGDRGPGDFDIIMNYDQIQWDLGNARIGYSNGSGNEGTSFELPGSGQSGAFLDSNQSTGLINNSRDSLQLGRYSFTVENGAAPTGSRIRGTISGPGPLAQAPVQVCPEDGGDCVVTQTNDQGGYSAPALDPGTYVVRAQPPAGNDNRLPAESAPVALAENTTATVNITLPGVNAPPPDTTLENRGTFADGSPIVYWNDDLDLTATGCEGGGGSYEVRQGPQLIRGGGMTESEPGVYRTVIPRFYPNSGYATVIITIDDCPNPDDNETIEFNIYIDPSGFVRTVGGDPIVGATVTLFRSDSSTGPFEQVPDGSAIMSPANRQNPDLTDDQGHFGWDTIAGYYVVRAEMTGCHAPGDPSQAYAETEVLQIPPPVTDLDIRLDCGGEPPPPPPPACEDPNAIVGDDGDNTINGTEGPDIICGLGGDDNINGLGGDDVIVGGAGNDRLRGSGGNDDVAGNEGNDDVFGGNGDDDLDGGDGDDLVFGQFGEDTATGGNGNDGVHGHSGDDDLDGGPGDDRMTGREGEDFMDGGTGNDQMYGQTGDDNVDGEDGDDRVEGDEGDDRLRGSNGADRVEGGVGNDDVFGGNGDDVLRGEDGDDLIFGQAGHDQLFGGAGSDGVHGQSGSDQLDGGAGDDRMTGREGNDSLIGGPGMDDMFGEAGADFLNALDGEVDDIDCGGNPGDSQSSDPEDEGTNCGGAGVI